MDVLVWGETHGVSAQELAPWAGLDAEGVEVAYREISRRREATAYLHAPAIVLDDRPAS
jgi:NAD+ synthase